MRVVGAGVSKAYALDPSRSLGMTCKWTWTGGGNDGGEKTVVEARLVFGESGGEDAGVVYV